jgi:hypothetical protein
MNPYLVWASHFHWRWSRETFKARTGPGDFDFIYAVGPVCVETYCGERLIGFAVLQ